MQERHSNREQYFKEQIYTTEKHVIPFVREIRKVNKTISVLEIGCGEGGNLMPFLDMGCDRVVGVDLSDSKIENAKKYFENHPRKDKIELIAADIYDTNTIGKFDLIITRDVIEHIHNQDRFFEVLKNYLAPGGHFFAAFPAWHMPYGGHQQICRSKFASKMPYYHILPVFMYRGILKMCGESQATIENLLEVKSTGITIDRLERILNKRGYNIDKKVRYFINPNYEVKFKLKPRVIWSWLGAIPYFRNYFITAGWYLISLKDGSTTSSK
jgi:2-polyprenyl-3-methyl-5-hydroxy-6-metoxy-1,4-benzoquinol methylase